MTADDEQSGGQQYDAPNQQVVRPDASGPADEGTGGDSSAARADQPPQDDDARRTDADDLDAMTKAQLHGYAVEHGVQVNSDMTKDDIRQAIEEAK